MSFRGGPRSLPDRVALIEELLRKLQQQISGAVVTSSGGTTTNTFNTVVFVPADPSGAPASGFEVQFNTNNNLLWIWNGSGWVSVELT